MSDNLAELHVFSDEPVLRIAIDGEIDMSNVAEIRDRIQRSSMGVERLVLDLRAVTFMGSEGVRLLYELTAGADRGDWLSVLVGPGGIPAQVLTMTRMSERVPIITDPPGVG